MNTNYLQSYLKIEVKSKKNIFITIVLILMSCLLLFIVENKKLGEGAYSWESYHESVSQNVKCFQSNSLKEKRYRETYDNLNQQSALLAQLENSQVFEDPKTYFASSIKLINKMLEGYKNNYAGATSLTIMSKPELYRLKAIYQFLSINKIPIALSSSKSSTYLIFLLTFLGSIIFLVISLITSDIWMPQLRHVTILKNVPYSLKNRIIGINLTTLFITICGVLLSIIAAFLLSGLRNGFSTINYPVSIYTDNFYAIPIWQYVVLFVLYIAIICIFTTNLSILLNKLTKNVYLTIFGCIGIYFLGYLPSKWICILPCAYLNITNVFNGELASNVNIGLPLNFLTGIVFLLFWTVIVVGLFVLIDKKEVQR